MDTLGIETSSEELAAMVNEWVTNRITYWDCKITNIVRIDASGDGNIDFEEFVEVMSKKVSATYTADQVKHAFRYHLICSISTN